MKLDRVQFAKRQILSYVEEYFTRICDLCRGRESLVGLMNAEPHGLSNQELIIVLYEMFQAHLLVARRDGRGLFTPALTEVEGAAKEEVSYDDLNPNTYHGLTSSGLRQLKFLRHTGEAT